MLHAQLHTCKERMIIAVLGKKVFAVLYMLCSVVHHDRHQCSHHHHQKNIGKVRIFDRLKGVSLHDGCI